MIVTWILSLIIIIIFSIFIFRKMAKNNINDKYEICTYGLRKYNIIAFIIYILGFVFMVMSIFMVEDIFSFWCCLILGLFLIILTLVIFIDNNFSFEAIKGDKFYVSRFFKTREIKISKIRKIHSTGIYMIFYSKEEKKICMVDSSTRFIQDIVSHMQIYYNVKVINGTELEVMHVNEEETKEDEDYEKYNELGKQYRKDFKNIKKNNILYSVLLIISYIVIFSIIGLILKSFITVVLIVLFVLIASVISYNNCKSLNNELKESDYNLGIKHYIEIKNVIGSCKYYLKSKLGGIISILLFGVIFSLVLLLINTTPVSFNELIKIEGTLDYAIEMEDYIAFGLIETDVEYRLNSIEKDYFDYDFFDEVIEGEKISLYVEDKVLDTNNKNVPREFKSMCHYVEVNEITYFTYDDYIDAFNENNKIAYKIGYLGLGCITVSMISFVFIFIKYKQDKKKEFIKI